jgi:hypothetical protein
MVRGCRRSKAQKSQVKTLAITRKAQSALPNAQITLLSKTRTQAGKKRLEELIKQKETLVEDLSLQLIVARGEITACHFEIQRKDDLILDLNLKIVTLLEDAAITHSWKFDILLENNILELQKLRKRSQRLTKERRLTKSKHYLKIRRLTAGITEGHRKHLETLAAHSLLEKMIHSLLMEIEKLNNVLSCEKSANMIYRIRLTVSICNALMLRHRFENIGPN